MIQYPPGGTSLLVTAGDTLTFSLQAGSHRRGTAFLRTNLGRATERRREIIAQTEAARPFLASDWHDLPLTETAPGHHQLRLPLLEPGWFAAKCCFIPAGSDTPEWPEGDNLTIKVLPAASACANSLYTAFVRQFREPLSADTTIDAAATLLDRVGYHVIPPSGTFRNLIGQLDFIIDTLGFRLIQLLPIHPTPTTYARMGRYGSPFASLDYYSVDPALAEFDRRTTPLEQFRELVDAVHARRARILLDLPANHTGWASTLQTHHPDWFERHPDGSFKSPGAWGTVWEDLVELNFDNPALCRELAAVFLYWCRQGVDGFRCDAGYMIPTQTWRYIVARVRQAYPETIFLLEGLGGPLATTDELLTAANLDWAYSELFQTEERSALERYLPDAFRRSQTIGPLIHFAETHDNNRLAARGTTYARLRTTLAALLSHSGAFGITSGVEWFATAKVDVHGCQPLNWGAADNQVDQIAHLNRLLAHHPAFTCHATVELITRGPGNSLAARRTSACHSQLLIVANLDLQQPQRVMWQSSDFAGATFSDLLTQEPVAVEQQDGTSAVELPPGGLLCLAAQAEPPLSLSAPTGEPPAITHRRRNLLALRLRRHFSGDDTLPEQFDPDRLGEALLRDPHAFCAELAQRQGFAPVVTWQWPGDIRRELLLPADELLLVRADSHFRAAIEDEKGTIVAADESLPLADGSEATLLLPQLESVAGQRRLTLNLTHYGTDGTTHHRAPLLLLSDQHDPQVQLRLDGARIRQDRDYALLTNGRGAMSQVRAAWGSLKSQYDALLAVNPHPALPDNRRVFLTRCRAWLRYRGYSYALDATSAYSFQSDPGGTQVRWRFVTPIGMGREVAITISATLIRGKNRLELHFTREAAPRESKTLLADGESLTLILRPDIEARDFHTKTKAYSGPEQSFPAAISATPDGFRFAPGPDEVYHLAVTPGRFHHDPRWSYAIPHPEEIERGLGHHTDLFSPGWFAIELKGGSNAILVAATAADFHHYTPAKRPAPPAATPATLPLSETLLRSLDTFVVRRDSLKTVIAGYPWFLDWGRDTLIVLRGLVAAGRSSEALEILREFGRLEIDGTIPNMIRGEDHGNRDTSDAPLWFMVATHDLIRALGSEAVLQARCGERPLYKVLLSLVDNIIRGTPNGIVLDDDSGLIFSPSHYTWMDTNYPAATPRQGYPVEIQALWLAALEMLRCELHEARYKRLAEQGRASLLRYFVLPQGWLADSLRAAPGQSAHTATAEDALRPNQLLAITLGAIPTGSPVAQTILRACETLLVPGAIRSLADRPVSIPQPVNGSHGLLNDPHHPYWGHYRGDEDTRRKPAYHNGTAWGWPFPLYAEALLQVYGPAARSTARALLLSALPLLESGCLGHLPEIVDGDVPHRQRGCGAQAWSTSELLRVWHLCATTSLSQHQYHHKRLYPA